MQNEMPKAGVINNIVLSTSKVSMFLLRENFLIPIETIYAIYSPAAFRHRQINSK